MTTTIEIAREQRRETPARKGARTTPMWQVLRKDPRWLAAHRQLGGCCDQTYTSRLTSSIQARSSSSLPSAAPRAFSQQILGMPAGTRWSFQGTPSRSLSLLFFWFGFLSLFLFCVDTVSPIVSDVPRHDMRRYREGSYRVWLQLKRSARVPIVNLWIVIPQRLEIAAYFRVKPTLD